MDQPIICSVSECVATLTIARPARKNALNNELYLALSQTLDTLEHDHSVHTVVLTGHGEVFCAGNDIEEFIKNPSVDLSAPVMVFLQKLSQFPKPIIAAVNGVAVGIGVTMLLHCDLVYAAEHAQFSLPFVKLGLVPEAASTLLMPMRMGYLKASELLLLGALFNADDALEYQLINRVLPSADVVPYAMNQAKRLAGLSQDAVLATKQLLKAHTQAAISQQMMSEGQAFSRLLTTEFVQTQLSKFMNKSA